MLSEHGIAGIVAAVFLATLPIQAWRRSKKSRAITATFLVWAIAQMFYANFHVSAVAVIFTLRVRGHRSRVRKPETNRSLSRSRRSRPHPCSGAGHRSGADQGTVGIDEDPDLMVEAELGLGPGSRRSPRRTARSRSSAICSNRSCIASMSPMSTRKPSTPESMTSSMPPQQASQ